MSETETPMDRDAADAAEYVLGLMPEPDRAAFEARLAVDPALRARVREWEMEFARLLDGVAPLRPRAELARRIAASIAPAAEPGPQTPPAARRDRAANDNAPLWRGLAAASVLVAAILGGALWQQGGPGPLLVAQMAGGGVSVQILAQPGGRELRVTPAGGGDAANRVLQLWMLPVGASVPVSLGLLPDEGTITLDLPPEIARQLNGALVEISLEPPGGSPTGRPTGPVLAKTTVSEF